jgi:hypothetical protein
MDGPLPLATNAAGRSWPERRALAAGGDSPTVVSANPRRTNPVPATQLSTDLLSPVSTELEIIDGVTSATMPSALHSANSSSSTWSSTYQDEEPTEDMNHDVDWEHEAGDESAVPKTEPVEDDCFRMDDVQEAPRASVPRSHRPSSSQPKAKRPRGRPRKHPLTAQVVNNKVAKGRSKTGCITCRKRKKKCDEQKPRCET